MEANAGGFWGAELKFAGYDFIIVVGRSKEPEYVFVEDEEVSIGNASSYWGLDAREADRAIRRDLNDGSIKVADIGQAGENLVRFAAIMNDEATRAAARCGVGAVMGSKNLKAIAVRGHNEVKIENRGALAKEVRELNSELAKDEFTQFFHRHGTPGAIEPLVYIGDAPVANWTKIGFDEVNSIGSPGGYDEICVGTKSCYNCPVVCRRVVTVKHPSFGTEERIEGPEYESLASLGTMCMVSDVNALVKANELCNIYGLDTISAGSTIAFAMECYEKGLIDQRDTSGQAIKFGERERTSRLDKKNRIPEWIR